MPINYIPNDPLAQGTPPMRQQNPRSDRNPNVAGFTFFNAVPQAVAAPGTPEFLFWQCREAALAAVETWEALDSPVTQWARATPNIRKLELRPNDGDDLNAYYDGQSLSFFEHTTGGKTTFSGASTDVVSHEMGHALLDLIRPDLWDTSYLEVNAFHEAFGDCITLLTAFADAQTRDTVLATSPDLGTANFLEATAEDLSDGVQRDRGPNHPAAAPRHALNNFGWQLPSTLPPVGPPQVMIAEAHSFARIFSGCFYDTIRNIFAAQPTRNAATLSTVTATVGRLLITASRSAPEVPRFFRAVGRAMILVDQQQNNGANHMAIRNAFTRHNIALGSASLLAPTAGLVGRPPRVAAAGAAILSADTRRDLLRHLEAAPNARLAVDAVELAGEPVARAVHRREVPLDDLDSRLRGAVAIAAEHTLVGASGTRAAVLGALPQPSVTTDEVHAFVRTLLATGNIQIGRERVGAATAVAPIGQPTHVVRARGNRRVLTRVRFACYSRR